MLGMLSMLMLQTRYCTLEILSPFATPATSATPIITQQRPTSRLEFGGSVNSSAMLTVPKSGPVDYFNLTRAINGASPMPPSSPEWPRLPPISPMSPPPPLSNPSTSRGSWSSLFGAGGVKQFVQETFTKDGQQTPSIVLDPSMVAENIKSGEGKTGRTLSGGSGGSGRVSEGVGVVATKQQQQQPQQKKGKQRRESAYSVLQPQPQSQSTQMGPPPLQQLQTGLDGPPPPPLLPPSTRSRSEIVPGPLKASLSFSSTSSGGSSGTGPGTGMKRSPLVPVENVDWGMRRRGGGREADKGKKRVVFQEDEGER